MTVKELIEKLEKIPEDTEIITLNIECGLNYNGDKESGYNLRFSISR